MTSEYPDDRTRFADFAAREAERLNTPEMPRFANYEAHEGWRSVEDFTRYGDDR